MHLPGEKPPACRRLEWSHRRVGCATSWGWGQGGCAAPVPVPVLMPVPALCPGKPAGKARLSVAFPLLPAMFPATGSFVPQQCMPSRADWLAFCRPACAPALSLSDLAGMDQTLAQYRAQVQPCLSTPTRGAGRPLCPKVCAASALPHAACTGQLQPAPGVRAVSKQWVESRKQSHGKQDLAPPPPLPATAPWPLSFPCSRKPFPQPSATRLH